MNCPRCDRSALVKRERLEPTRRTGRDDDFDRDRDRPVRYDHDDDDRWRRPHRKGRWQRLGDLID